MKTLITNELVKIYKKRKVVNEVSFQVKQGEIIGLLGPNGAGKTTTFYMIVGLVKPDNGKIFIQNDEKKEDITRLPMYQRAKKGIGYLSQDSSVFRNLTVEENIKAILEVLNLSKAQQKEKLDFLLKEFGIEHIVKNKAYSLSGGERRRVEVCRTLATEPLFILLDEPFSGIDPITVEDIQSIIIQLKNNGFGIIITDHNVREILKIVDRAYIIQDGKIFASGLPKEIEENSLVRKNYLGENFKI
ncbi:MAG: LPS export ABC transporter ATP-binding protein [bacterium]